MLRIALMTVRARWTAFAGTFIALALGVGMMATMFLAMAASFSTDTGEAPRRYAGAPVVVHPADRFKTFGEQALAQPRGLRPDVAPRVSRLGTTVPDRVFYAQPAGEAAPRIGRPWSMAGYARYRIVEGRAPAAPGEVVVAGGQRLRAGTRVPVLTAAGPRDYAVVGLAAGTGVEAAVFFTDQEAARLSPRVDALVTHAPIGAVRDAVGDGAEVGAGAGLRESRRDPLADTQILLGVSGGIAGFVAIFVVASTFAFGVAQRRRELALLRAVGATPRQVRRMLFGEAVLVGVAASAVGCALGLAAAPLLGDWLVAHDLAPEVYRVAFSWWPLAVSFATGVTVSLLGVWTASRRAGRIRPGEALREAALEGRVMTAGRWLAGTAVTATAVWMLVSTALNDPSGATNRKQYLPVIMLLIWGAAILAPALVPPLARLVTWPLGRLPGAGAMVVRENALTAARRTATTAAPVLVTVGLFLGLLATTATIADAEATELRDRHRSDFVVVPAGAPGLNRAVLDKVRAVPGVETVTRSAAFVFRDEGDGVQSPDLAMAVDSGRLLSGLPVLSGSPSELDDDSIVVGEEWRKKTGDRVDVGLADGTTKSLRVAAVIRPGMSNEAVLISRSNAGTGLAEMMDVRLLPGTGRPAALAALRTATAGLGAEPVATDAWIAARKADGSRVKRLGMLVMLGVALVYCGIAIANTLVMAAAGRVRDQAVLRLAGATSRQVLRVVVAESLVVVAVGTVLAVLASALSLGGLWVALAGLNGHGGLVVPWGPVGGAVAWSALIAVVASVVPARAAARVRAARSAGE